MNPGKFFLGMAVQALITSLIFKDIPEVSGQTFRAAMIIGGMAVISLTIELIAYINNNCTKEEEHESIN